MISACRLHKLSPIFTASMIYSWFLALNFSFFLSAHDEIYCYLVQSHFQDSTSIDVLLLFYGEFRLKCSNLTKCDWRRTFWVFFLHQNFCIYFWENMQWFLLHEEEKIYWVKCRRKLLICDLFLEMHILQLHPFMHWKSNFVAYKRTPSTPSAHIHSRTSSPINNLELGFTHTHTLRIAW